MDNQLQAIRDQQLESWNRFSGGWKKWNDFTMEFLKPMGDAIIQHLEIKDKDIILDIACGSGDEYWQCMNDVAASVAGALAKADDAIKKKIKEELYEACNNMLTDGKLIMNYSSTIISGVK